ncbi:MAG: hypothetical protein HZB92_09195 [Euryarchaeota archaeon]|nr:hypothetical protein [Euryarchaeota archaeon]
MKSRERNRTSWQNMTNISFWVGSYNNLFEANFTENVPTTVTYYVNCTNSANLTTTTAQRNVKFATQVEPTNPLNVAGRVFLYNGSIAGGYNPGNVSGATVSVATTNLTGVITTLVQTTDMAGNYIVTFQPNNYTDGGLVWVNTTTPGATSVYVGGGNFTYNAPDWRNWTTGTAVDGIGFVEINATLGIPYNLTVAWVPDWTLGSNAFNTFPAGTMFNVLGVVYDNRSRVAPGYYGTLAISTNESNAASLIWGGVAPGPVTITLDGLGGIASPAPSGAIVAAPFNTVTDGVWNDTATLWNGGVWALWVNDTYAPASSLAPGIPGYSAFNETDNTHVRITGSGFFWKPLAGWNIISVPMNTTAAYGAAFMASEAGQAVQAAASLYGVALTQAFLSRRLPGSPATYQTWDVIMGAGVDFSLDIDHAYWLYVSSAITAVWVQADQLMVGDPLMGIAASGVNTVSLDQGWNMVNSGLNASSREWAGHAPVFVDAAGNVGNWSDNTTIFYTGGGQSAGAYYGWYDQPAGASHVADRQDSTPGNYLLPGGALLRCANTWDPATQSYVTGCSYADWFGLWRQADGYNNYGRPLYYASGFWVYAEQAGNIQYDING